jgi:general stress protein 26
MSEKDPKQRLWELIADITIGMVVTHSGQGDAIRGRPMAARPRKEDGAIYFLTDVDAPKDEEIEDNANVCIAFADPKRSRYVSVTGMAHIMQDAALAASLWSLADREFWPNSSDARIRVVKVDAQRGEFWEGPGLFESMAAMLKGGSGTPRVLGENEKVLM